MKPVCVECKKEMFCKLTGALIRTAFQYYYSGDIFECPKCHRRIVNGFGNGFDSVKDRPNVDLWGGEQLNLAMESD